MALELWDAYTADGQRVEGRALVRGETVPEGLFHLVCDILVKHRDGTFLLMQRDRRKPRGGLWEATAGGSALQGETAYHAALRELREETGIAAEQLTQLGTVVSEKTRAIYLLYLCVTDWDKEGILLQEGETIAYRWVSREELLSIPREELAADRMLAYQDKW